MVATLNESHKDQNWMFLRQHWKYGYHMGNEIEKLKVRNVLWEAKSKSSTYNVHERSKGKVYLSVSRKFKNLSQMVIVQVKPRYSISHWWFGGTLLWPVTCWEIGVLSLVSSTVFWWNTGARGKQGKYPGVTEAIGNKTEAMQWCNGDNGDNYLLENIFIIITPPL